MSDTIQSVDTESTQPVVITVNGTRHERAVPVRMLLSDFLRHELRLTGTHVGCEHGVCGCCTVQIDGRAARSCLTLAVQCHGAEVQTVESLAEPGGELHPVQQAFRDRHALQCGFCTPGFLMTVEAFLRENPRSDFTEEEIREAISGNLCRCTCYTNILDAVKLAAERINRSSGGD
jgi:aerobic carbon-monoxide dehydrogenase small subunit